MNKLKMLLLLTLLSIGALAVFSLPTIAASTETFTIYQNNNAGGKGCSGQLQCFNFTSPGPSITVNQGDSVSITVHNNDTTQHTFSFTSSTYSSHNTGTMNPSAVMTITFTASTSGTFTYQCDIHPSTMNGTFKVNAVSSAPVNPIALLGLLVTAAVTTFIISRKRR